MNKMNRPLILVIVVFLSLVIPINVIADGPLPNGDSEISVSSVTISTADKPYLASNVKIIHSGSVILADYTCYITALTCIYRSDNGGSNWFSVDTSNDDYFESLDAVPNTNLIYGIGIDTSDSSNFVTRESTDNGNTFSFVSSTALTDVIGDSCIITEAGSPNIIHAIVTINNEIFFTDSDDAGVTYSELASHSSPFGTPYNNMVCSPEANGSMAILANSFNSDGSVMETEILDTLDSGITWNTVYSFQVNSDTTYGYGVELHGDNLIIDANGIDICTKWDSDGTGVAVDDYHYIHTPLSFGHESLLINPGIDIDENSSCAIGKNESDNIVITFATDADAVAASYIVEIEPSTLQLLVETSVITVDDKIGEQTMFVKNDGSLAMLGGNNENVDDDYPFDDNAFTLFNFDFPDIILAMRSDWQVTGIPINIEVNADYQPIIYAADSSTEPITSDLDGKIYRFDNNMILVKFIDNCNGDTTSGDNLDLNNLLDNDIYRQQISLIPSGSGKILVGCLFQAEGTSTPAQPIVRSYDRNLNWFRSVAVGEHATATNDFDAYYKTPEIFNSASLHNNCYIAANQTALYFNDRKSISFDSSIFTNVVPAQDFPNQSVTCYVDLFNGNEILTQYDSGFTIFSPTEELTGLPSDSFNDAVIYGNLGYAIRFVGDHYELLKFSYTPSSVSGIDSVSLDVNANLRMSISYDGQYVLVYDKDDDYIKLYSTSDLALLSTIKTLTNVVDADFDSANNYIYSINLDKHLYKSAIFNLTCSNTGCGELGELNPAGVFSFIKEPAQEIPIGNEIKEDVLDGGVIGNASAGQGPFGNYIIMYGNIFPSHIDGALWFFGILLVFAVITVLYRITQSAISIPIGAGVGVIGALVIGWLPVWFLYSISFLLILLISKMVFFTKSDGGTE